ncbi:MAG TPA: ABC transporter permease subunit [Bryobacteraceae bacterium]
MTADWSPLWLSLRVALMVSIVALVIAPWPAWRLARRNWPVVALIARFLSIVPAVIVAALVAPAFTWPIAVAAGLVRAVPYTLAVCHTAFQSLNPGYVKAARMTGASSWRIFYTLALPLGGSVVLAAAAEVFSETTLEMAVALWIVGRLSAPPAGAILLTALAGMALALWLRREAAAIPERQARS